MALVFRGSATSYSKVGGNDYARDRTAVVHWRNVTRMRLIVQILR